MKRTTRHAVVPLVSAGILAVASTGFPGSPTLPVRAEAASTSEVPPVELAPVDLRWDADVREANLDALRAQTLRLIEGTGWRSSEWGVLAVSLEHGDTLLAVDADRPMAPASNQKIFTSAGALHHLGADYRFSTFLLTDGPVTDGVLAGDLIVYGTGDPAISDRLLDSSTRVWREFARSLKAAGVHTVAGDLIGDGSYFQGPTRRPSWNPLDLDEWYAAPTSALTFAENVVTLRIGGGVPGGPAEVRTIPERAALPIRNESSTISGRPRTSITISREHPDDPIQIRGHIGTHAAEVWRRLTVSDPAMYAASVFLGVLEEEGIRVQGTVRSLRSQRASAVTRDDVVAPAFRSERPVLRTLAVHRSPPLSELIDVLNKRSHNLYAEILLFTIGRVTSGDASFHGGSAALTDYLVRTAGVREQDLHVEDGSGLSRLNRATPAAFVQVLRTVAGSEHADTFWASLPVAGNRRELGRMYQTPAAGNLRAKTGTIDRVSALSGFVRTADGEPVLFSIVSNNVPSSGRAKRVEDGIGAELAAFARTQSPLGRPMDMVDARDASVSAAESPSR